MASLIAFRPPRPFSLSSLLKVRPLILSSPPFLNPTKTPFLIPLSLSTFAAPNDYPRQTQWNNDYQQHQQHRSPNFVQNNHQQQQPRGPNQWNNQNQGYPRREIPNQANPVGQNPNFGQQLPGNPPQWSNQAPNRAPVSVNQAAEAQNVDLVGMAREGKVKEIIELMEKGTNADGDCFYELFDICGNTKSLENAKKVHDFFLRSRFRGIVKLNNKVLEMYGKCGSMVDARRVFDHMPERNLESWHLMIKGYARNSLGDEGLQLFEKMKELGLQPTRETFSAVLDACAGAEAVEEGFIYLENMRTEYGVEPELDHYLGVLDVLGASGRLAEAQEYIEKLPMGPSVVFWEALRGYARIHGDIDLEDHMDELIVDLDPSKSITNKLPTPPPKRYTAVNMMEGRNRLPEFKNPTLYIDDEKYKAALKEQGCPGH